LGYNDSGSYDSDRNDDFLDSADWMADVPAAPAFEEDGWHSDELDERIDMVIRNPEPPLRFVRPHSRLMEGNGFMDGSGLAEGRGLAGGGGSVDGGGLVGGSSLVEGPDAGIDPG
jgi:hypothetical protein